jgi:hypothetical protein
MTSWTRSFTRQAAVEGYYPKRVEPLIWLVKYMTNRIVAVYIGIIVVSVLGPITPASMLVYGESNVTTGRAPSSLLPERHLANIRQLTFGRQNAEAYFSFDGRKLIFQSTNNWMKDTFAEALAPADTPLGCYQMYVLDLDSEKIRMVSTGVGATTCGYFFPGDRRVLFSSTHLKGPSCPPKPRRDRYLWIRCGSDHRT